MQSPLQRNPPPCILMSCRYQNAIMLSHTMPPPCGKKPMQPKRTNAASLCAEYRVEKHGDFGALHHVSSHGRFGGLASQLQRKAGLLTHTISSASWARASRISSASWDRTSDNCVQLEEPARLGHVSIWLIGERSIYLQRPVPLAGSAGTAKHWCPRPLYWVTFLAISQCADARGTARTRRNSRITAMHGQLAAPRAPLSRSPGWTTQSTAE